MTRHYPGLDSASDHRLLDWSCRVGYLLQPIRSTTQVWEVTRYQEGISALVSQTSFRAETIGSVAKCLLFSQATLYLCRYRRLCRLKPGPHLGHKTQVLATPLGLSRNLWTIRSSLVLPVYPDPKHKHSICYFIFRVISFPAFWKFLGHGNSSWFFGGLSFGPGIFWGFVGSPRDFLGVLIFATVRSSPSLEIQSTPCD